ncbi:hypothetical protein C8J55DRAFT_556194 [Lentinula edodes]|uniref:Uncharacterized protein n=1 Tax=Lentinula lateritia TaxID=40482 RepID=A0A9W9AW14_9AGAR|nr:hypothetical protein C8J55DRAFT_556194 [Lentinula edodes]
MTYHTRYMILKLACMERRRPNLRTFNSLNCVVHWWSERRFGLLCRAGRLFSSPGTKLDPLCIPLPISFEFSVAMTSMNVMSTSLYNPVILAVPSMAELFALVSTTVSIAFQVKTIIEQIKYNREAHRLLVNRITSSLRQLKAESRKITKSSPELISVVNKLKTNLQRILDKCLESTSPTSGLRVKLKEWFLKDSIASALQEVETQISYCFQEFGALGTIRIERKLGDHSVQINRKLDELLRRTPAQVRNSINNGTVVDGDLTKAPIAIPLQVRTASDSSSNSSINALNVPGVALKSLSKTGITPSRMISRSKELSIQVSKYNSTAVVPISKNTSHKEPNTFAHGRPRFMGFLSSLKSENSVTSMSAQSRYEYQANELDSECKRLRSHQHLSEALIPGRKAVVLRRLTYATDKSVTTTAALARSLTYLTRCLKDIHVDSRLAGTQISVELTAVLSESIALYKLAFKEDKACRVDLATALYNLSVLQSEPPKPKFSGNSSLNPNVILNNTIQRSRDLTSALAAAEEAVHHFTILEREDPDAFGMDLANALVNLSFILSDNGSHEEALSISRKAVMLAYRFNSTDPHTHERARNIRTLHKALTRVSFCLYNLGRIREAQEAEMEANDVLKRPFFIIGS